MYGDAHDHARDPDHIADRRDLGEYNHADHRRSGRQERDHQRVRGTVEPSHRELIGDIGDH
jgi:hypothetical protein